MTSTQYYRIPATVIQDRNLSFFARLLYGVILSLSKRKGNCFSHNQYFSELLGVSEQYISKAIKELKENGYITVSYKREGEKIIQRIIIPLCTIQKS